MRESWHGCLSFRIVLGTKGVGSIPIEEGPRFDVLTCIVNVYQQQGDEVCHCTVGKWWCYGRLAFGIANALRIMVLALRI